MEVYTGEQFKAGTDANVSIQIFGERGDTGLRRLLDSKTNSNKFEGGEVSIVYFVFFQFHLVAFFRLLLVVPTRLSKCYCPMACCVK